MADPNLENQIQNALSKEPTLTSDSAHVTVSGNTIELAGTVGTNKEKITATRIVQSYAGSMKLVNRLTVGRAGEKAPPQAPADKADGGRQPDTADPANNPEPGKSSSPSPARPPQR
jgi:osmotically-inducible protein OsmY